MAEPSSPPHSANSQPLIGKPTNKRKPTTTTDTHPPKRRHVVSSSNSDEIKDTASSIPEKGKEIEEVEIADDVLYGELAEYEIRNGVNPVVDYHHMQRFCFPYIHLGVGNEGGWEIKIRHLKYKFKDESEPLDPDLMKEFSLWKRMFARDPPPDAGSRIS